MTDHLTLCSEERLRELLKAESELAALREDLSSAQQECYLQIERANQAREEGARSAFEMVQKRLGSCAIPTFAEEYMTAWRNANQRGGG